MIGHGIPSPEAASRLIEWRREKAGTIAGVHDVLKNELAAGVMPSKYFGTNAWERPPIWAIVTP